MKRDPKADSPARQIYRRGNGQKASFLAGPKVKGMIQCESVMEATYVYAATLDPRVKRIAPQPRTFELFSGKEYARREEAFISTGGETPRTIYTPDFETELSLGTSVFTEVKHRNFRARSGDLGFKVQRFLELGLRLVVVTDELLQGPLDYNCRLLQSYLKSGCTDDDLKRLQQDAQELTPIQTLIEQGGHTEEAILSAITQGHLAANLTGVRLRRQCVVRWSHGDTSYLHLVPL